MQRVAYYNEIMPDAAEWLRECIKDGLIADGDVDERSITEVRADDLRGYTQCHFFAGIGIWSAALRLAGWDDARPVWTGSCPCQDFSAAGKGEGTRGHRDLWPVFAALIRECRPATVFGEQVSAAIRYGWLDRLRTDLEAAAYAVGGVVLGAHSAGADHDRRRLYWVAKSNCAGLQAERIRTSRKCVEAVSPVAIRSMADTAHASAARLEGNGGRGMVQSESEGTAAHSASAGEDHPPLRVRGSHDDGRSFDSVPGVRTDSERDSDIRQSIDLWRDSRWHACRDGKSRRVPLEPRLFPLADAWDHKGYRVAALRGAGNAINIGTAAGFIQAWQETRITG